MSRIERLAAHPRPLLAGLALIQVAGAFAAAVLLDHNGWLWVDAGEQVTSTTDGWLLGRAHLPPAGPGYMWPLVLAPATWVAGATWLQVAPFAVFLSVLVLGPLALACVYGIALRLGGRLYAAWTATVWVAAPFVAVGFWLGEARTLFVDGSLPEAIGLSGLTGFPSLVALAAGGWLVLRALDGRSPGSALLAGLAVGAAAGVRPSNLLVLAGAVPAFVVARRWRELGAFACGVAPGVLTVVAWRLRVTGSVSVDLDMSWDAWTQQMSELREFSVGARVAQWAPLAGLVALGLLRRWAGAVLLAGWLGAFLAVEGTLPGSSIEAGTFLPRVLPALPAYVVLVAAVPLLVPTLIRRLGIRPEQPPAGRVRGRALGISAAALALVPLLVVLLARSPDDASRAVVQQRGAEQVVLPVDEGLTVRAAGQEGAVLVTWDDAADPRTRVWYRVLRTIGAEPDVSCVEDGAIRCRLTMIPLGQTRNRSLADLHPRPGTTYRVAVLANVADDEQLPAEAFAVSPPARTQP